MVVIRDEKEEDIGQIRRVNELAFGQPGEAHLVDLLRDHGKVVSSLVAVDGAGNVLGHILFTRVQIEGVENASAVGLGPMAVLPEHQKHGIGSRMIEFALKRLPHLGVEAVVVVGHPEYYPRFGFVPASHYGLKCKYEVPEPAFMVLELRKGTLIKGDARQVNYEPEFDQV